MFMFTERIDARNGSCKTKQGVIKLIKRAPVQIPIHNVVMLDRLINTFALLADYFKLSCEMGAFSNRLILQLSNKADEKSKRLKWFKRALIGKNNFDTMVKTICQEAGVKGLGLQDHMTNHGLLSSMILALIDSPI